MGFFKATILVTLVAVVIACIPSLLRKRLPNKGAGFAAPGWRKVADTFRYSYVYCSHAVSSKVLWLLNMIEEW